MHSEFKLLTETQRRMLCEMMHLAFLEIRNLDWTEHGQQAADLADAFHNLPHDMWESFFSLQMFRDGYLQPYQKKYPSCPTNYTAMLDGIISTTD
jgi:hypothetical protein